MQEKQKATLYLSTGLHHQLKIRSAFDRESMSVLAERAISFYLSHAEIVEAAGVGHIHQVFNCPECTQPVVFKDNELIALGSSHSVASGVHLDCQDEELVPC